MTEENFGVVPKAEYDALVRDANRYRFIRQYLSPDRMDDFPVKEDPSSPEHGDALIDAAMIGTNWKGL